jgi:hypothetical protein
MNRLTLYSLVLCLFPGLANPLAADDTDAIREVIQQAYIQGIHIDGDGEAIRSGFHPSFVMFVQTDDGIRQVLIEDWISRIEERQATAPGQAGDKPKVKGEIDVLDQASNAAVARVKVYRGGKLVFTDFMSLYRFEDGWKIVGKIFHSHP